MVKKIIIGLVIIGVIGIIAWILFDPLEKLREVRDDQRISDLAKLKKAIDLYINNNAKDIAAKASLLCTNCKTGQEIFSFRSVELPGGSESTARHSTYINATGWVPLDLTLNAKIGQTPLKLLPIDPLEKGFLLRTKLPFLKRQENFVYTYSAGLADKYKLTAKMESEKGLEKAKNDGGILDDRFELGTDLSLKP